MSGEKEKCLAIGMNDYISKPFKAVELHQKINEQIFVAPHQLVQSSIGDTQLSSAIDLSELMDLSDNNLEFVREILELFVQEMTVHLQQLEAAIEKNDDQKTVYLSHKLKSSIPMIGMDLALLDLLTSMEQLAKSGNQKNDLRKLFLQFASASRSAMAEAVITLEAMRK
jgi:HPt (histidine-containing phosphotransfer) domain-containing protein